MRFAGIILIGAGGLLTGTFFDIFLVVLPFLPPSLPPSLLCCVGF